MMAGLFGLTLPVFAADMANGHKINKSCALCHGIYGQGAPGKLSPRIAGLPKEYIIKAMKEYHKGEWRNYPLMNKTSKLDMYTEKDFDDVATYLANLDLSSDAHFDIKATIGGEVEAGKEIYKDDCKSCHARDGYGKPRKEAPPLAGQHPEYLFTTMLNFRQGVRVHDNDPEDKSFADYSEADYLNLTAYLATLDDKRIIDGYVFEAPQYRMVASRDASALDETIQITDIVQTVVRMAVTAGVTPEQAADAMNAKAEEIGLKKVAQQRVSRFLAKKGVEMPHLSIYQFCNPMDAREMIIADPVFSSYLPFRISMVEDKEGKLWLMMLNLDMLINSKLLPASVVETAVRVNQQMLDVMTAGAAGKS
mgnify:CR=1 FL=1